MNELDEQLQERLAQLEAGEPLTTAGAGLPAEVAEMLAFAAALQDVALPEPDETAVIAHRAAAIRAAQQMKLPQNEADPTQTGGFSAFWAWWRGINAWPGGQRPLPPCCSSFLWAACLRGMR